MPYAIGGRAVTFFPICIFGAKEGGQQPVQIACRIPNPTRGGAFLRYDDPPLLYKAWAVSEQLARNVKFGAHRLLDKAGKRIDTKWFDVPVEWAKKVILVAAQSQHIPIYTDADLERIKVSRDDLEMARLEHVTGHINRRYSGQ
jgi:hypothetical protein